MDIPSVPSALGPLALLTLTRVARLRSPPPPLNSFLLATRPHRRTECKMPLSAWQAKGNDVGSYSAPYPSDETVVGWAKEMLGF